MAVTTGAVGEKYDRNCKNEKFKSRLLTLGLASILALSFSRAGCSQKSADDNLQRNPSNVVSSAENDQQETAVEIGSRDDFEKMFDGRMTWDGSESGELVGADESVKLEELK